MQLGKPQRDILFRLRINSNHLHIKGKLFLKRLAETWIKNHTNSGGQKTKFETAQFFNFECPFCTPKMRLFMTLIFQFLFPNQEIIWFLIMHKCFNFFFNVIIYFSKFTYIWGLLTFLCQDTSLWLMHCDVQRTQFPIGRKLWEVGLCDRVPADGTIHTQNTLCIRIWVCSEMPILILNFFSGTYRDFPFSVQCDFFNKLGPQDKTTSVQFSFIIIIICRYILLYWLKKNSWRRK